jgi:hypothetical protein
MNVDQDISAASLAGQIERLWELSAAKLAVLRAGWNPCNGAPVYTAGGRYTSQSWTEWTDGFLFGSFLLQFDATGDCDCLDYGRSMTLERMRPHVTHAGVHDHGFNNISTYGTLLRLAGEERIQAGAWERRFYELALCCSGAVQAMRWSDYADGGFIYSFNGPQSLFADTIRSLRVLAVAHQLGHVLKVNTTRRFLCLAAWSSMRGLPRAGTSTTVRTAISMTCVAASRMKAFSTRTTAAIVAPARNRATPPSQHGHVVLPG